MIVRLTKDYKHYEILYESYEEAQAVMEYQNQLLVRGFDERTSAVFSCPNKETNTGQYPSKK